MARLKNYTRADMLSDFSDPCIFFEEGGGLDGAPFTSIYDDGAIAHLWLLELQDHVDDDRLGAKVLDWPAPDDAERAALLSIVDDWLVTYLGPKKAETATRVKTQKP